MEDQAKKSGGNKKTGVIIAVSSIIILALIATIIYLVVKPKVGVIQETADGRGVILTPENKDEILNAEPVPRGYFETCMTNDWTFVDGESQSDVYIKNADSNRGDFYFEIFADSDRNNLIYSSPYVPVGAEMPPFKLTGNVENGDYTGVILYHTANDETNADETISIAVTLHIK